MARVRRRSTILSAIILLVLSPLYAADDSASVCTSDPTSAYVFIGELTALTPQDKSPASWMYATFRVHEMLQGEATDSVKVLVMPGMECGHPKRPPSIATTYLVLTKARSGFVDQLEHCEQLVAIENAAAELRYLRDAQAGKTPTEILGEVIYRWPSYQRVPITGTKIKLLSKDQQFEYVSDEDGNFRGAAKSGKYQVVPEFPAGFETEYGAQQSVTVVEHRCTKITVVANPTASFTAHLVDAGGAKLDIMSNVQLTLATAEDNQFVRSIWPDEDSNLVAKDLPAGDYVLGLNTYLPFGRGSAPYPPIYYPGVRSRAEATVITLSAGEHKVLAEMRITKGHECEIPVFVSDSAGKASPQALVAFAYRDFPHFYVEPRQETGSDGTTVVYAVFPGPVFLRADHPRADHSGIVSDVVEVDACPTQPVMLKLAHELAPGEEPPH